MWIGFRIVVFDEIAAMTKEDDLRLIRVDFDAPVVRPIGSWST